MYTDLFRLDKIYNFSRLDLGIGMRPDFHDSIIPFLWPILPTRNPSATGGTETISRLESRCLPSTRNHLLDWSSGSMQIGRTTSSLRNGDLICFSTTKNGQTVPMYQVQLLSEALP